MAARRDILRPDPRLTRQARLAVAIARPSAARTAPEGASRRP